MQFTKVHGLGNDFILVDGRTGAQPDFNALAPALCSRRTGVGADGVLVVLKSDSADIRMRIVNADGSEAEMCGNGIRAFSKYVFEAGIVTSPAFSVETLAGVMRPELILQNGTVAAVRVDMGEPVLEAGRVPVLGGGVCVDRELALLDCAVRYTTVRVGVPHTVVFVPDPTDPALMALGRQIECAPVFPQRTNVNFARVLDAHTVEIRTWERGCGPTLACGTGACSTVVACALNRKTGRSADVRVALGTLHIDWADDQHVYMTGPAETVYTGQIDL